MLSNKEKYDISFVLENASNFALTKLIEQGYSVKGLVESFQK
jgi:hypothetical protein